MLNINAVLGALKTQVPLPLVVSVAVILIFTLCTASIKYYLQRRNDETADSATIARVVGVALADIISVLLWSSLIGVPLRVARQLISKSAARGVIIETGMMVALYVYVQTLNVVAFTATVVLAVWCAKRKYEELSNK